ncbi:tetratricopeptide repeat protein [Streptomyces europaeiscabiei]|uniref:tetratricopeptide repeat protein n=1 Tax=Streptomyces europaeiscabiei TaxID=146819 RepID=UPI0038F76356
MPQASTRKRGRLVEIDRLVQIRVNRLEKGERRGFGSGYLVAPRLVLTAAHVLDHMDPDADSPVTVTRPDTSEQEFPAVVRWQRTDATVDAALIEITEGHGWQVPQSLGDLLTRPPQRYGLIIGTRPQKVTAIGSPRMQKDDTDGTRGNEQFFGAIAPGTGSLAGHYEPISTAPTFAAADITDGGSRWSGMSGAAVLTDEPFDHDLLCGVVRRDRQADTGGTRLTATPAAALLADQAFCALITEHTGWKPVLEPVEPVRLLKPAGVDRSLASPAALLRADAEAVGFHGRDSELATLRAWCENGKPALQVRVLTGPGGQGKTRLARRLTETLDQRRWVTGHLGSDLTDDAAPPDYDTLATSLNLLLVVDYAETRPRLVSDLIAHLHRSRHHVRILLLARSDGPWRTSPPAKAPAVGELLAAAKPVPLAPLLPTSQPARGRHDAFRDAARDLALLLPLLNLPTYDWTSLAVALRPPADLHDSRYDNVLTLQMAALVALLQHGPRPVDTPPGTPLEGILLLHEQRFWEGSAKGIYKLDLPITTLGAGVAVASLCGAGTQDEALRVLKTLPGLPAHQTRSAAKWVSSLYPPSGGRYWGSLQPDRIAEYHASCTLTEEEFTLPDLLGAAAPGQQAQLITVLARAAIAHYNADRVTDSEQLLRVMDTALDSTPLAYQAVQTATAALPSPSRITSPLALRLTTVLAHADQQLVADDPAACEPDLARSLSNLGIRLVEAGRRGEALTPTEQAVVIWRRLAKADPAAYEPDLARSLSNLGIYLAEAGRRGEALTIAEQAVKIWRRLAADNPAAYGPDLARSLSNLGIRLAETGRRGEALTTEQQVVEIWRRLAKADPATYEPDLATSLSNLGIYLAKAGRRGEALTPTEQAVKIWRRLAADNPAAYETDLARSLSNLGIRLAETGRRGEALTPTEQAVVIWRRLAKADPATYEPDLARSLSNLGSHLAETGRRGEALTTEQQVVEIWRRLAKADPATYEPDLATSLSNLGIYLAKAGRRGEALTPTEQAVKIWRRLAADNPATYGPDLAHSLSNLGIRLAEAGRLGEALTPTEQAVVIWRRLAADNPVTYGPDLAHSLSNLGSHVAQAGRLGEALTTEQQVVEIWRRLAKADPAAYEPDLAHSLTVFATLLAVQGQLSRALRATGEAVELYRTYVATIPSVLQRLHTVLGLQADLLEDLGDEEEAEAVRRWLRENPLSPDSHN